MKTNLEKIKVWDPVVRFFHWSLVVMVGIAFLAEDEVLWLHITAGYMVLGLILVRLPWGLVGTRHARFSDFIFRPRTVVSYLKDMAAFRARRYVGHGPAGGAMVITLLGVLLLTGVTGLGILGGQEFSGPLAGIMSGLGGFWSGKMEALHEFFAGLIVILVVVHVAGVLFSSLLHGENLVRAMVDGNKRAPDEEGSEAVPQGGLAGEAFHSIQREENP